MTNFILEDPAHKKVHELEAEVLKLREALTLIYLKADSHVRYNGFDRSPTTSILTIAEIALGANKK